MRSKALHGFVTLTLLAAAASAQWRSEGPFLANGLDVAVDPTHTDTVYLATQGGGVWRSEDGGGTWTLPGDEMTSRKVNWLMVDPGKSTTLWAGVEDAGMWRSLDRGATWKQLEPNGEDVVGLRIAFAPSAPQTIFVPSTNLHYRTADGGKTWTSFRVAGEDSYAIAVHPTNPKIVLSGGRGQTLNLARSQDGGKTWKQTGIGIKDASVHRIVFDPTNPSIVYAYAGFRELFKSTDGGDRFTPLDLGIGATDDVTDLDIDPGDPKVLWAATEGGLEVSEDAGETWHRADRGTGDYIVSAVALVPGKPGTVLAATNGGAGLYKTSDGGGTWSQSNRGLAAAWVKKVWAPAKAGGPLYVQTGVGLFRRDGGTWAEVRQPFDDDEEATLDGILYDRTSPQTVYAFSGSKYWRSTDGGRSWREPERKEPGLRQMMRGDISDPEFKSMAQDAGDAKTFYAGAWSSSDPGHAVYKTTDGGKTWKPSGNGLPEENAVEILRSGGPKTVYAVVAKDGVFRTRDGGGSWTNAGSGLPGGEVRELVVSPTNPAALFAATEHGLFQSADGGDSWKRTGASLAEEDIEAVVYAPGGDVFAGAFEGIYRSTDGGATWTKMNGELPNVDVRALAVEPGSPGRLYAGFGGGSVWSAPLP